MKKILCLLLTAMLVLGSTAMGTALADDPDFGGSPFPPRRMPVPAGE